MELDAVPGAVAVADAPPGGDHKGPGAPADGADGAPLPAAVPGLSPPPSPPRGSRSEDAASSSSSEGRDNAARAQGKAPVGNAVVPFDEAEKAAEEADGQPKYGEGFSAEEHWMLRVLFALTVVQMGLFGGAFFGWANLQLVLEEDGVFADGCSAAELADGESCASQENSLNLVFTCAVSTFVFMSLPGGALVDFWGPARSQIVAGIICILGTGLTSMYKDNNDVLYPSFVLLGAGGMLSYMSAFPLAFLFGEARNTILAVVSVVLDASSVVLLIFFYLYDRAGLSGQTLFLALSVIGVFVFSGTTFMWYRVMPLLHATKEKARNMPVLQRGRSMHHMTVASQVRSYPFFVGALFAVINISRSNFYLGTNQDVLAFLGDEDKDFLYTNIFGLVLPFGFLCYRLVSWTIDNKGLPFALQVISVLGAIFTSVVLVHVIELQIVAFVVYTAYRAFLFSTLAAFTAFAFGPRTVGRIHGLINVISGLVGVIQFPLVIITNKYFDGDYFVIYLCWLLFGLLPIPFVERLRRRGDRKSVV